LPIVGLLNFDSPGLKPSGIHWCKIAFCRSQSCF